MHQRKVKVGKEKGSDDESEIQADTETQIREPTPEEIAQRELDAAPLMPDSEISPAAYIFQNMEQ